MSADPSKFEEWDAKRKADEQARIEEAREHDRARDRASHEHNAEINRLCNEHNAEMNRISQGANDRRHAAWLETMGRAVAAEERQAAAMERIAEVLEFERRNR